MSGFPGPHKLGCWLGQGVSLPQRETRTAKH